MATKAVRAKIKLGTIELDVFQLPDGNYSYGIEYLASLCGKDKQILSNKKSPYLLSSLLRNDKTSLTVKIDGIGYSYKTINQSQFGIALGSLAKLGHSEAINILEATFEEALERRADSAFNVQRSEDERNERLKSRIEGKVARRSLTDWIKHYIDSHDVSDNYKKFIYANCSDAVNQRILGCKAKQARGHYQLGKKDLLRDKVPAKALKEIQFVEEMASRLIDQGVEPLLAVNEALERCYSKTVGL